MNEWTSTDSFSPPKKSKLDFDFHSCIVGSTIKKVDRVFVEMADSVKNGQKNSKMNEILKKRKIVDKYKVIFDEIVVIF